jgi:hypothetical protein
LIATQREDEAIALLETRLAATPNDADAQWLLLHALFAHIVRNSSAPPATRDRFTALARRYVEEKGANAALAQDWLVEITNNK